MSDDACVRTVVRYDAASGTASGPDELAAEEPLEIRCRGRAVAVTMRTPGHDAELAAGFLLSEGVVARRADVLRIEHCDDEKQQGNVLNVLLAADVAIDFARLTRHVFASSSCGLCGKATIDAVRRRLPPAAVGPTIDPAVVLAMPDALRAAQAAFARTGGLHAAGLFDASGNLLIAREDVGRHNAVDKVIGRAMLDDRLPLDHQVLLVSGRASFEIVQKALAAGVTVVAAVSAPSSLAAAFAEEAGQTLIGFLRPGRMNVYAHPHRLFPPAGGG